ncbi:MAG: cation:proton antiporter [Methylococcales bacterium]|nr:cation:proton antiporter [Methylococcales bacterium]MDD5755397.1 cation:proton antiporter [Methylococcales bacterium]
MNHNEVIFLGSAYFIGLLASRLSFPPLVGYLIAGYGLNFFGIASLPALNHLADLGIELLLFTVGLKIKLNSLLKREVLSVGGLHLVIVTGVSALLFFWQGGHMTGGVILGASLAFSSTVLAIKVLEDNGELSTFHGRDVLSILILQDIIAIGLLAVADGKNPTPWAFGLLALPLLRPFAHRLLSATHSEDLRLLLGVFFALVGGLIAKSVDISPDIGALLMGVTLASHTKTEDIAEKLWGLKEVLLVAFFLQIGLNELPSQTQVKDALLLLALLPLQGCLFFALFLLMGLRARTAFISSLALMTYSEFALITTEAVVKAGLLSAQWQAVISLSVAGSLAIAAPLNRFSHRLFSNFEPFLTQFERKTGHPDRLPDSIGVAEWLIFGMGRTGTSAYLALHGQEQLVVGFDADPTILKHLLADGRRVVYGDAEDTELWDGLPLERIKGIILTMPDFEVRCSATTQLRKRGFTGYIGTICYYDEEQQQLQALGADIVVHPLFEAGSHLAKKMFFS